MVRITQADQDAFIMKVMKASDDLSDAKIIEEIKGLITRKPNLLKARSRLGWNCFRCIKSVELAGFIYKRDPSLINERHIYGRLPIHDAAEYGRLPILKFIAEKDPTILHGATAYGATPLLLACRHAHFNVAEWILTRDPSTANHVDSRGQTALHWVAHRGTGPDALLLECAKLLLQRDPAMRFAKSAYGKTPVMVARRSDGTPELTFFLEKLEKHDETIDDAKSFWSTVKAMLLAMEADKQDIAPLCDSTATKTKKTAIDALVVVAEWTKSVALNAKRDITNLIRS